MNRKKNKRALKLWRKARVRKADKEVIHDNIKIILQVEEKEGKSWIAQIYRANGLPVPRKRGGGGIG